MRSSSYLFIALLIGIFIGAGGALLISGSTYPDHVSPDREIIFQVSTIDALLESVYDGVMPVSELTRYGDLGIGTFDSLDGELIMVDGVVYQARADGSVVVAAHNLKVPLAAVTFFDEDIIIPDLSTRGFAEFEDSIGGAIRSENLKYAIRIDGTFPEVTVRAPHGQERPYPRLVDALADQYMATHTNITGTAVGFLLPEYVGGLNVPGYHLHFISDDLSVGGHIVDFSLDSATVSLDETLTFMMRLPSEGGFIDADLTRDLSDELAFVERPGQD
ncbi:acetolactate decarboxylase [Methanocalculus taiwanensis]|uniref:Alpha-acetolactate decarboxylase n=1 Tax=Methanocalculus taiwanensis TaxID=106207 RepID=A0ABD4TN63_9EURY|nr:acetolactate decarboxylase [Methanocalculus taiwanensis]MCQ1539204.1 acetolactate decarboxylase [Methanocalculus taiwanensis]